MMTKQQIIALQKILADAGFYKNEIDGMWGPKSQAAAKAWEEANGKPFKTADFMVADSIGGVNLVKTNNILFTSTGATVDADGAPHAYHPSNNKIALDYLAAAGHPGNWWGVVTKGGKFVLQGKDDPAPGYCISVTSLKVKGAKTLATRQMNAEEVPFIVLPGKAPFAKLGDYVSLWYPPTNIVVHGFFGDVGPRTHWGEISYKAAEMLQLPNPRPKDGGVSRGLYYFVYPGSGHAAFNSTKGEFEIDPQFLTIESINSYAQPLWEAAPKVAVLAYYNVFAPQTFPA